MHCSGSHALGWANKARAPPMRDCAASSNPRKSGSRMVSGPRHDAGEPLDVGLVAARLEIRPQLSGTLRRLVRQGLHGLRNPSGEPGKIHAISGGGAGNGGGCRAIYLYALRFRGAVGGGRGLIDETAFVDSHRGGRLSLLISYRLKSGEI